MKRFVVVLILVLGFIGNAFAFSLSGTNITVADQVYLFPTGWYGMQEDEEVEPYCVQGQGWDLEAFYQDGQKLYMVGGYDFINGIDGIKSGDLFLGVGGGINYGPLADDTGFGTNVIIDNTFGFDYAFDFNMSTKTYNLVLLDEDSQLLAVLYEQNEHANPVKYVSGGQVIASGIGFDYFSGLSDANAGGLLGGSHNVLGVDLGFLGNSAMFFTHFTQECGNDNLVGAGKFNAVPEPATLTLFGLGLFGVTAFGRRRIRR